VYVLPAYWLCLTNLAVGLAFTAKHIDPEPAVGGAFAFKKLFGDDDFIASGVITFPVGGKKPLKGTKDNTYVSCGLGL
jgi:centromere protein C